MKRSILTCLPFYFCRLPKPRPPRPPRTLLLHTLKCHRLEIQAPHLRQYARGEGESCSCTH